MITHIRTRRILLAVLLLLTASALFFSCSSRQAVPPAEKTLGELVTDNGQTGEKSLSDLHMSDFVISLVRPEVRVNDGEDEQKDDWSADTDNMEGFEGSGNEEPETVQSGDTPELPEPTETAVTTVAESAETETVPSETEAVTEPDPVPADTEEPVETDPADETVPAVSEPDPADPYREDWIEQGAEGQYTLYDVPLPALKQIYVIETAEKFGIPAELVFGVMYVETRYTETAISSNGKYIGIMQISKNNLKRLTSKFGITDLQDFTQNVTGGAYFLSYFYKKYDGDIDKVLMCYHCGEGSANVSWRNGVFEDGYCRKVKKEITRILNAGPLPYDEESFAG